MLTKSDDWVDWHSGCCRTSNDGMKRYLDLNRKTFVHRLAAVVSEWPATHAVSMAEDAVCEVFPHLADLKASLSDTRLADISCHLGHSISPYLSCYFHSFSSHLCLVPYGHTKSPACHCRFGPVRFHVLPRLCPAVCSAPSTRDLDRYVLLDIFTEL